MNEQNDTPFKSITFADGLTRFRSLNDEVKKKIR